MMGYGLLNVGFLRGVADLWSIDGNGKLTVKEMETEKVTVKQTDNAATIDRETLPSGQTLVQVHNTAITSDSRIFVTFHKNPGGAWWIDEVSDGFFILRVAQAPAEDAVFDYWLIGVNDQRTPPSVVNPPAPPAPENPDNKAGDTAPPQDIPTPETTPPPSQDTLAPSP